ncbi:uncharacterized protein LOC132299965 [Cornus florida]|uniref:uncharacterized protein LOC132299965 n=1 Tax=Cornus florida TaxID=4283 RepID=UPI00289649E3|nr:uncharacterized protein LOC132299965 [Cornus florida]
MASSAFKSTSKRGTTGSDSSSKKELPRKRSSSVSAVSRTQVEIPSEFLNKRDNPLFWSSVSPPDKEIEPQKSVGIGKSAQNASKVSGLSSKAASDVDSKRGRSVTRKSDAVSEKVSGGKKEIGRSLSRVGTGRRVRSVSIGHYGASESEVEQESVVSSNHRNRSNSNSVPNDVKKARERTKIPRIPVTESAESLSSLPVPNWEDGISIGSLSEAEEKTIKAVCEQMESFGGDDLGDDTGRSGIYETVRSEVRRAITDIQNDLEIAIRRSNATAIATTNVADLPPDLVNPGAVELVLDIRREYATKLEESQERARKLQADLAVEEHRGLELSRILKEVLPDPKTTNVQKSRLRRKASTERRKISKNLTEEAMAYFDECVSISTFDSSDFSATEELPFNLVGAFAQAPASSLRQESPSISTSYQPDSGLLHNQESVICDQPEHSRGDSGLTANSSSNEPMIDQATLRGINREKGQKFKFSFARKLTETVGFENDIRDYIKKFEKDNNSEIIRSSYYDLDEYNLQDHTQNLLFDRVFFKNRIESGSLHLCGGAFTFSFSPFASVI